MTNVAICATINGMKVGSKWTRGKRKQIAIWTVILGVVVAALPTTATQAIIGGWNQNSPYPAAFPTGNPDARHILIWSNHGKSTTLVLKLLYDPNRKAGPDDHVTIYDPAPVSTKCTLMDSITRDVVVMRAYANGSPLGQILAKQMCEDGADTNYANAKGKVHSTSSFTFVVPAATINNTPPNINGTGMKEVTLTFQWNPDGTFPAPHDPVRNKGTIVNSGEATVSFGVRSANGQLSGATTQDGVLNNSLVPRQGGSNDPMAVIYNFGLPCSEQNPGQVVEKPLALYDLDSSRTHFFVQEIETGANLPRESYSTFARANNPNVKANWNASKMQWDATDNDRAKLIGTIKMKADKKYRLVITGLKHSSTVDDLFHNYVYVGVPGDVIYGESWFTCPSYKLPPSVDVRPSIAEIGERVTVSGAVGYEGNYNAGNHQWYVDKTTIVPGQPPTTTRAYTAAGAEQNFSTGPGHSTDLSFDVPNNATIGTKYCFVTTVIKWTMRSPDGEPKSSSQQCVIVGIKPKMQVWGYDARSGEGIGSSKSNIGGKMYSSFAEYGTVSRGAVIDFASGAATKGGGTGTMDNWKKLTFANTGSPPGNFGTVNAPTGLVKSLRGRCDKTLPPNATIQENDFNGNTYIICVNGTATIKKGGPVSGISATEFGKQRVIIADNINIDPDVENINAWLIAADSAGNVSGTINTCGGINPGASFKHGDCKTLLRVNGATIANKLYAYRTNYDSTNHDTPAEVFNLRGDAFVWIYNGASGSASVMAQTTSIRELPPRF